MLFVDPELEPLAAEAPAGIEIVRLGDEYERLVASGDPAGVPSLLRDEEEPIAIDYTSGTTGPPEGRRLHVPRRVSERARRGDRGRARPPPGLPVDAADVPLQRLVLPVGGDRGGGHARVPAGGRSGADLAAVPRGGRHPLQRLADRADRARQPPGRRAARAAADRARRRRAAVADAARAHGGAQHPDRARVRAHRDLRPAHGVHVAGRLGGAAGGGARAPAGPPGPGATRPRTSSASSTRRCATCRATARRSARSSCAATT